MAVTYKQLCPVLFGAGAIEDMAKQAAAEGKKRAYIICDQGVKMAGAADKIKAAAEAAGLETAIFDGCIPDAPDTFIDELAEKLAAWGPDLILGVGGGSSMDAAKAAGVVLDNGKPIRVFMEENGNPGFIVRTPVYVIPTSAGTGSECTPMCVIHEMSSDTKKVVLRPAELAVLDPELTVSCPPSVTVNSGMDALSHAVEAYTSVAPNPKDMLLAIHAIKLIAENLPVCVREPENIEARSNMLFASNIAGIAFAEMSVHIGHCFSHEAGLRFHLNHGLACGLSVPATIEYVAETKAGEVREIGEAMGIGFTRDAEPAVIAKEVADGVRALMKECGLQSLSDLGIGREEAMSIAEDAIAHNWFHVMCPGDVTPAQMEAYIANIYDYYR